jgi:hypothetical protein
MRGPQPFFGVAGCFFRVGRRPLGKLDRIVDSIAEVVLRLLLQEKFRPQRRLDALYNSGKRSAQYLLQFTEAAKGLRGRKNR